MQRDTKQQQQGVPQQQLLLLLLQLHWVMSMQQVLGQGSFRSSHAAAPAMHACIYMQAPKHGMSALHQHGCIVTLLHGMLGGPFWLLGVSAAA
jgi:hypothetical protein